MSKAITKSTHLSNLANATVNQKERLSAPAWNTSYKISTGRSPLTEFRPDATYVKYANIADIKRSGTFGFIHIGVGNPIGGWALRLSESPIPKPNPRDIPEGIWIAGDKIEDFRLGLTELKLFYNKLPKTKPTNFREEIVPCQLIWGNDIGQVMLATMLQYIDNSWKMLMFDTRGNEMALDDAECNVLIGLLDKAKATILKKVKTNIRLESYFRKSSK